MIGGRPTGLLCERRRRTESYKNWPKGRHLKGVTIYLDMCVVVVGGPNSANRRPLVVSVCGGTFWRTFRIEDVGMRHVLALHFP